eukprot:4087212-Prymnesium_polylepis.1
MRSLFVCSPRLIRKWERLCQNCSDCLDSLSSWSSVAATRSGPDCALLLDAWVAAAVSLSCPPVDSTGC